MTKILFNDHGVPLIAYGTKYFASTSGAPEVKPKVTTQTEITEDKLTVGNIEVAAWGPNNDFPKTAYDLIRSVGVLNTGLKFIRNFTLGQGVFPCHVKGYDDQGNEQLEVIDDEEIVRFCNSRMVRRYLEKATRDYFKFGCGNVQLIPNEDGSKMVGLNAINSMFCRISIAKKGVMEKVVVSGKWPDTPGDGEFEVLDLLDEYDPLGDINRRKMAGKISNKSLVFAIRDSWSNAEYYGEPIWWSAYLAGWIDIAKSVPSFLKKAYQNQITWKWHVKIPYAFWDRKFAKEDYPDPALRRAAIETYMDSLEENLCGVENADKPIFTFFEINPNSGKAEEQWIIEPLDNKYKDGDKLITSAAANSEILFALMINPNVLGAGMPGGTYSSNQGGSNIREAFLVNIANAWIDRQNILDPLEIFLEYNGITDVQLRFRSTILTTLDTGAGTSKTLS
jgi:hypothetical protein